MKKFKKIFAIVLAMAMVLGMSVTTFAATGDTTNGVDIPVTGAENASFEHLCLVEPDSGTETGWKFSNDTIAGYYKTALKVDSDQQAIWKLIAYANTTLEENDQANIPSGVVAATESEIEAAATQVANNATGLVTGKTVHKAGMYYIRATEPGYAYNPMVAYVSFQYNENGAQTSVLETAGVNAKKTQISTEKTDDAKNNVTEIGRKVTYYISSMVPFVPAKSSDRVYKVKDTINGARYNTTDNNLILSIYYGASVDEVKKGTKTEDDTFTVTGVTGSSFEADLTDKVLGTGTGVNAHANQSIVITYEAIVTDTKVGNTVEIGDGTNDGNTKYGSDSDDTYTGQITIKKEAAGAGTKLAGAKFIISKGDGDNVEYARFDNTGKFVEWTKDRSSAVEVETTGTAGSVVVTGLAEGTYHITETVAPEGYSINENIDDVTITANGEATSTVNADTTVKDTTLSSLPSTGGIGTTIFTIGGCAIIIVAAGLFFASRRKKSA